MSKTGITKGPSQMDDNAVRSFIKYLAANPETRQYVLPLLTVSKGNVNDAARELEHKFLMKTATSARWMKGTQRCTDRFMPI